MFEARVTAEWGDCDPAGIVFYPRFFSWMDAAFQALLRHHGLSQQALEDRFGAVTPLVEVGARFRQPVRPGDGLRIEVRIVAWEDKRLRITYCFKAGGRTMAEGFEVRAWAGRRADGGLAASSVDPAFRALFA